MTPDMVTEYAVMFAAVAGALGVALAALRVVVRVPRMIDGFLDNRALARVRKTKEEQAIQCLITLQPKLVTMADQLAPNGGSSVYDKVTRMDLWQKAHVERHNGIESTLETISTTMSEIVAQEGG